MKCGLCGAAFEEEQARSSCAGCSMGAGCGLLRCPNCGFETPPEPRWLKKIQKWRAHGIER